MTTNLDIIKKGLKKLHVLGAGQEPSAVKAAAAMDALQDLIIEMIGQGSLGTLYDYLATSDCTAYENQRIHASSGVVVTLPLTITGPPPYYMWPYMGYPSGFAYGRGYDYGYAYYSQQYPRPPRDRTPVVVITDNVPIYNVWRSYTNEWVVINGLGQQDDFPFTVDLENGFAALLAERLVDDYAQQLGPETARQAGACRLMLASKYDSVSLPAAACYF